MRNLAGTGSAGRGFSLIEVIAAILVMSVVAMGVMDFITNSASGYASTATRNQLSSAGRVVIDRIAMELHNAVPLSVRITNPLAVTDPFGFVNDQCIEFLPIMAATNYINPRFRPAAAQAVPFDVINTVPDQIGNTGRYAVIYPTDAADLYKDSYTDTEVIFEVSIAEGTAGDGKQELNRINPPDPYRFSYRSPDERLFITTEPVSFCVSGSRLYRYSNYGLHTSQRRPYGPDGTSCAAGAGACLPATTPDRVLITDQIDNSVLGDGPFDYLSTTRRRNGVIQMQLNFSADGQTVLLNHEVLQQATP